MFPAFGLTAEEFLLLCCAVFTKELSLSLLISNFQNLDAGLEIDSNTYYFVLW